MRAETSQPLRYGLVQLPPAECLAPNLVLELGPPAALPPAPAVKWKDLPPDLQQKWRELRKEFAARADTRQWSNAEDREWKSIPAEWRMALLLLAGVDGDLGSLANRDFQRMPLPERAAVKSEVRLAGRLFARLRALASPR